MPDGKKFENYEDYIKNRTVADIMEEASEWEDEWRDITPQNEEEK